MSRYRRITGQIITLLTLLASILGVLRQVEYSGFPFELMLRRGPEQRVENIRTSPVTTKVKTRIR
jgi:hypothetical protein